MKKQILFFILGGFVLASGLVVSAFTEPTTGPDSTTSYPPINLSKDAQIHSGKIAIGDGSTTPSSSFLTSNTLYVDNVLGLEELTVRKNATFVGNVSVEGNMSVAGALRVPMLYITRKTNSTTYAGYLNDDDIYDDYAESSSFTPGILFEKGATTNLGRGNCQKVTNSACPTGYILSKYNPSTGVSSCRAINPVSSPDTLSSC